MTKRNGIGEPMRARVLIFGGRDLNATRVRDWLTHYALETLGLAELEQIDVVIQGGQSGADEGGMLWSKRHSLRMLEYPALWRTHGRAAGPIRNQQMLDEGRPTIAIGFPGGNGTKDMTAKIRAAISRGMPLRLIEVWRD